MITVQIVKNKDKIIWMMRTVFKIIDIHKLVNCKSCKHVVYENKKIKDKSFISKH